MTGTESDAELGALGGRVPELRADRKLRALLAGWLADALVLRLTPLAIATVL
jgi:hypothetical protein